MRNILHSLTITILLIVVFILLVIYFHTPAKVTEDLLHSLLEKKEIKNIDFSIPYIDKKKTVIKDIAIGDKNNFSLEQASIHYDLQSILDKKLSAEVKIDNSNAVLSDLLIPSAGIINASGIFNGKIPLELEDGVITIKNGWIESLSSGDITFALSTTSALANNSNSNISILVDALENFSYNTLKLKLNSDKEGKLFINLSVEGKNKKLYDGTPIKLNVNLSANIIDIAESLNSYRLSKKIEERFLEQK